MEDLAAGTVDLGCRIDAIDISKAPEKQESAQWIRINREAWTSLRDFLERPFGASRETHLCRHPSTHVPRHGGPGHHSWARNRRRFIGSGHGRCIHFLDLPKKR